MGLAFGAGMGETLFGSQVGNVLTKITVVLSVIFLINTMILGFMAVGKSAAVGSVVDKAGPVPATPAVPPTPGTGSGDAGTGSRTALPDAVMPPSETPAGGQGVEAVVPISVDAGGGGAAAPEIVIPAVVPGGAPAAPEVPKANAPAAAPKAE
jgi:hypothetical protein